MKKQHVLGIDIGGTGIKAAVVDIRQGTLLESPVYVATPQPSNPQAILTAIRKIIDDLGWEDGVGCGFPGIIVNGRVYLVNNLGSEWEGVDFKQGMETLHYQ